MNKQFVMKMMQAKQLQYEALKEIIPEKMLKRLTKMEDELFEVGKEFLFSDRNPSDRKGKNSENTENKIRKVAIE